MLNTLAYVTLAIVVVAVVLALIVAVIQRISRGRFGNRLFYWFGATCRGNVQFRVAFAFVLVLGYLAVNVAVFGIEPERAPNLVAERNRLIYEAIMNGSDPLKTPEPTAPVPSIVRKFAWRGFLVVLGVFTILLTAGVWRELSVAFELARRWVREDRGGREDLPNQPGQQAAPVARAGWGEFLESTFSRSVSETVAQAITARRKK